MIPNTNYLFLLLRPIQRSSPSDWIRTWFWLICVSFAVSPGRLLDWPGVSREFNRAAGADHLCWRDRHETFFKAVRRVPLGTRALLSHGRLRLKRCWDGAPIDQPVMVVNAQRS